MGLSKCPPEECEKQYEINSRNNPRLYRDREDQDGMSVVRDQKVIDDAQSKMSEGLQAGTYMENGKFSYRDGYDVAPWYWFDDHGFWWAYQKGCRYWNAFGLERPVGDGAMRITCEINFPIVSRSSMIGGGLVRDNSDRLHIVHSGRFGGRYADRYEEFRDYTVHSLDWQSCVWYNDEPNTPVVFVSPLDDENLIANIGKFVHVVDKFKARYLK